MTGIDIRHRKGCDRKRDDGKCCNAGFQAHVWDARTGKRIRKTFPTRSAARLWRQDAIVALRKGEAAVTPAHGRTITDALDALLAGMRDGTVLDRSGRRYRPGTIRAYREATEGYLKPALGRHRLAEVRRADVQRLIDRMHADNGLAGSTIRNKLDPLRVAYRRAIQDEEVTRAPLDNLRLPALKGKSRQAVAPGRAAELLGALPDDQRALWATLFYCGLRIGEARALRWTHVDFEQGVIRVQAGWDDAEGEQETKTDAGVRIVPMTGKVRAELARHRLATGRGGNDLVFGRTASEAFTRPTVRTQALKAWGASQAVTPHQARHSAASYFAQAGLSLKEAQEAMGHADVRTTLNIYTHALPGWQEEAVSKLDAYLGATVARQSEPRPERLTAVPQRSNIAL